jgi:S1-C subfamily serine protease
VIKNCSYLTDDKDSVLEIIVQDEINDLAILKGGLNNSFLNIYKKSPILGEKIYVAGFPYNSDLKGFNFTSGNVSSLMGLGRDVVNFQITAPVQPGNSGGAVINEYGSVVGVIKYRLDDEYIIGKTDTIPQNINFAIKNTIIKDMMSENNIDYNVDSPFFRSSQKNIAQESKESSILIKCYGFLNES